MRQMCMSASDVPRQLHEAICTCELRISPAELHALLVQWVGSCCFGMVGLCNAVQSEGWALSVLGLGAWDRNMSIVAS